MGKPSWGNIQLLTTEYIGCVEAYQGTETSKYPEEEKTIVIPSVAASERGEAQTRELALLWDVSHGVTKEPVKRRGLERPAKEGKSPVIESLFLRDGSRVVGT